MALGGVTFVQMIPRASVMVAGLSKFAGSLRSLRDPLEEAVDGVLRPSVEEAFELEGPGWAPLAKATVEDRTRQGFSAGPILTRTGNLRSVATGSGIWHIDGQAGTAYAQGLPGAEYGIHHITGTDIMPQRDFFRLEEEALDQIEEIFEDFIVSNAMKFIAGGTAVSRFLR